MGWQEDGNDYSGMLSRIRLRGMDNGTLVMIDGHPANFNNASAINNIPVDQIQKIEVVKGAASVLYGPQAMAGVINVITKKPQANDKTSGFVYGSLGSRYKDAGLSVSTNRFNIGVAKSWTGDNSNLQRVTPSGFGPALETKDRNSEQVYGSVRITDDLTASYSHKKNHTRWLSGQFKNYKKNLTKDVNSDSTWNTYSLLYDSDRTGWKAGITYLDIDMSQHYLKGGKDSHYEGNDFDFDVQKNIHLNDNKDTLVLGGTYTREYWKSFLPGLADTNSHRNSYALYQSYDHRFTDAFNMIFGLREYWAAKSRYLGKQSKILPQVQGLYKLNNDSSLYFNVGKSFEMPDVSTNFYSGANYAINPDVKPQSSWSYEFGYKYAKNKTTFSADVFYIDATDKLIWGKTDDNKNIRINADKWKNYGLELNLNQQINNIQDVYLGLTLQNPKSKSKLGDWKTKPGEWSQDEAKVLFNLGTTIHKSKLTFDTHFTATLKREPSSILNYGKKSYYASAKNGLPPDHNLKNKLDWTASISYSPNDTDTFRVVGRNLLNRKDIINYDDYYATPRNVYFTVFVY